MAAQPKCPKLKILLVDLKSEAKSLLKAAGYNMTSGSFGVPYKVPRGDDYLPVIPHGNLSNFAEHEVVVNFVPDIKIQESEGKLPTSANPIGGAAVAGE
jgi:hypothetical protein